jgi:hypothetical protein
VDIKKGYEDIYREYETGRGYKETIGLFSTVKMNRNFYLGKQWEGVNAPDIEKPVVNILRQAVDYYVSMMVSDDISVQCSLPQDMSEETRQAIENTLADDIDQVFEKTKFKSKCRDFVKDCAIDGDAFFYWWYNTEKNKRDEHIGQIDLELIDSTNIIYGNPAERETQKQPYILIVAKLPVEQVKEIAKANGKNPEIVRTDVEDYNQRETDSRAVTNYATVITKLYREEDTIKAIKVTRYGVLKDEIDLVMNLYPVVGMSWRRIKDSYHGESPLTSQIQNQIVINKYYMMLNEFMKKLSFPKLLFDKTKIAAWSNKVEAIGVNGNPNDAIASSSPTMQMSQQVIQYVQDLIEKTKESMGVYDVALGNAAPDNTSAIIALQKTASQPLELQKMDYFQVVEDCVRVILALMASNYGERNKQMKVPMNPEEIQVMNTMNQPPIGLPMGMGEPPVTEGTSSGMVDIEVPFNYADFTPDNMDLIIDVGAAAYWSELMQIQSADNMYQLGIIPDPITYLEQIPNGVVKSKKGIIEAIKKKQAEQQMMMQQQAMMGIPPQGNTGLPG